MAKKAAPAKLTGGAGFHTRVLTRFASSPELKLEVSIEVPIDREQAQSKADETKSGLKELGLDDNAALS